jgi:hypothetical protein
VEPVGPHEFSADAFRTADGEWTLLVYTFGRIVDRLTFRTLRAAKAEAGRWVVALAA